MNDPSLQQKAAAVLEWDRVLEVLAGQARSTMGAERCRAMPLESDLEGAMARQEETAELVALAECGDPFPSLSFPDFRNSLDRVTKGAALDAHELHNLSVVLGLTVEVSTFLERRRDESPALGAVAAPLEHRPGVHHLKVGIDRAVDAEGNVRESATPDLRRLSRHAHDLKQQMRHRLEGMLGSRRYADILQEHYFAQREGRYVLPVKAELRSRIPGIVHDVSASGATVFLEPRELVELNNAIKVAELEVDREVRRILKELSVMAADHAAAIREGMEVLTALDCITAKAAFSRLVKGRAVTLNAEGRIALRQARHPLLVLTREHVVANDLILDESARVLVISGPNTGGKTVTLKMVGLFALMVRAGLQLPCAPDSEMAVFPDIFADIGDPQDLAKDLSSYSAHMTQMIRLLRQAAPGGRLSGGSDLPPALVLLDELVTSTDPAEGAALAQALLIELARLGMKVLVSTHYNALKILAQATPGFTNASVEFDVGTLSPTYRLIAGVPGGSSAIEIAGRLGMDERVLEHALDLLSREDRVLEQVLGDLQDKQRVLEQDRVLMAELRAEAERSASEAREVAERLRLAEREERKGVKKKLTEELLRARAQVQAVLDGLKQDRTLLKAKEAKRKLAELDAHVRERLVPSSETVPLAQLDAGARVELVGLGATGILLEAPQGKKRVRVRVGERDMSVASSQLVGYGERVDLAGESRKQPVSSALSGRTSPVAASGAEVATVLDLRGKTADEAMDVTVAALDQAVLSGVPWLRLIHGHGTGRLKAVLREYLKRSPYVATFRAGERAEGGDGVTVVQLKD